MLSGDYEEETQSSADDLTPSVTSHEATDFFPRTLRCKLEFTKIFLQEMQMLDHLLLNLIGKTLGLSTQHEALLENCVKVFICFCFSQPMLSLMVIRSQSVMKMVQVQRTPER